MAVTLGNVTQAAGDIANFLTDDPMHHFKYSEVQKKYLWEVSITGGSDSTSKVTAYAQSTAIPQFSRELITYYYRGKTYSYSGRDTSPKTFKIDFFDDTKLTIYQMLYRWFKQADYSIHGEYHRNVEIRLLATDPLAGVPVVGAFTDASASLIIKLNGVQVESLDEVSLDYSGSEAIGVSCNLKYSELQFGEDNSFGLSSLGEAVKGLF